MNIEIAYEKDILNRDSNYSLTASTDGAFTIWVLKDNGSHVTKSRAPISSHALHTIRKWLLNSSESQTLFWLTTTERNLLTGVFTGLQILNKTTGTVQTYDGSSWV